MAHPISHARGSVFSAVFIAVILIGLLTVAIRGISHGPNSTTPEKINIEVADAIQYGAELEQAVRTVVLDHGTSEVDIRFAHPDASTDYGTIATTPEAQVFSKEGGRAEYRTTSTDVLASGDGRWEFYGTSRIPDMGSALADLVAVLPNVTQDFCEAMNVKAQLTSIPVDVVSGTSPDCIESGSVWRFRSGTTFDSTPNRLTNATFSTLPAPYGCVSCAGNYHFYYVLMAR